ncbi:hypothetical protein BJ170DRAFT_723531 [Xylariales sp. AK1849]|nr:hypothetical protein BJ170DRAFT_723531 [Xylariales sp. AK1849]
MDDDLVTRESSTLLHDAESPAHKSAAACHQLQKPQHIVLLKSFAIIPLPLSGTLAIIPANRLAENIFCHRYHNRQDDIDEKSCKVAEVQSRMALLFGFVFLLDGVFGLLVAFPFGVLADRARKPLYIMGAMCQSLHVAWALPVVYCWKTLPVQLLLVGPVFQMLSGDLLVVTAVLLAMLPDVSSAESR